MENIVSASGLKEVTDKLDKGLETLVYRDFDDAGFTPSGGEGQKIAIARAAYKNAPIVILDEPTAALDPKAENKIYEQFDSFLRISVLFIFRIEWRLQNFRIGLLYSTMHRLSKTETTKVL